MGRVFTSGEPEMSHNVQRYDQQVYLRAAEAQVRDAGGQAAAAGNIGQQHTGWRAAAVVAGRQAGGAAAG